MTTMISEVTQLCLRLGRMYFRLLLRVIVRRDQKLNLITTGLDRRVNDRSIAHLVTQPQHYFLFAQRNELCGLLNDRVLKPIRIC